MATRNHKPHGSPIIRFLFEFGRYAWLDVPMLVLIGLFYRHFSTQGAHPAPEWFTYFYWAELGLYLPIKEGAHKSYPNLRTRWGGIRVGIWIAFIIVCALMNSQYPSRFNNIPPLMPQTVIIVIGVFIFGAWVSKKRVLTKLTGQIAKLAAKYAK
ncbi:MAG: hypothetical protein V1668_00020 [Patescibacteria group bacterium]